MSNAQRLQTRAECASHVPPPLRRFVAVLGSIGFRLLDFTSPAGRNLRSCKRCPLTVAPLRWAPLQRGALPPRELRSRGGAPRVGWRVGAARAAGGARSAGFFHTRAFRTLREALGRCMRTEGLGLASRATRRSDRRCSDLIFCCSHRRAQGRWTRPTCRPLRARCRS